MAETEIADATFEPGRWVVAKSGVIGTGLDDEFVMLDPAPGLYYGLNPVATTVWQFIQQPRRLDEIHRRVCAEFEVAPDRCGADIVVLLNLLVSRGLASYVDGPSEAAVAPDAR
jgi:hypothetical protein